MNRQKLGWTCALYGALLLRLDQLVCKFHSPHLQLQDTLKTFCGHLRTIVLFSTDTLHYWMRSHCKLMQTLRRSCPVLAVDELQKKCKKKLILPVPPPLPLSCFFTEPPSPASRCGSQTSTCRPMRPLMVTSSGERSSDRTCAYGRARMEGVFRELEVLAPL